MKLLFSLIFVLSMTYLSAQKSLVIEANATSSQSNRDLIIASNINTGSTSLARIVVLSGDTTSSEFRTETAISSLAPSYTASPGYAGYGVLANNTNGLILRSSGSTGDIKFLVGGTTISTNTQMTILSNGNIGIGTQNPASKLVVNSGDILINNVSSGVIMKSPNGTCWRLQPTNSGIANFTQLSSCPSNAN